MVMGHPSGLFMLFFTEMWERFSFYGMRAILVLFLVDSPANGGLGLAATTAAALYTVYNATVYLLAMPGGWLADRLTGTRRAVLIGGVAIAAGHCLLAVPAGATAYLGLIVVAVGTGLLQPNISTLVGELYDRLPDAHRGRRDSGFTLFYLGVNLGAWGGALATGWLGLRYGWSAGFAAAAAGMTLALVTYLTAGRSLGDVGREPHRPLDEYRRGLILRRVATAGAVGLAGLAAASVLLAVASGRSVLDTLLLLMPAIVLGVPLVFFADLLREHTLTPVERSRVRAFVPIFLAAVLFWLVLYQSAGRLSQLADGGTDNQLFGLAFPATWYQSVTPLLVVVFAPLFALAWARRGDRSPSTPVTFAIALLGLGGSFVLLTSAGAAATTGQISPLWLLSVYLVQALAELSLAPIGLSVTTRLAPTRFASQLMGVWFLAAAAGIALGGYAFRLHDGLGDTVYYGLLGGLAALAGLVLLLSAPRIRILMAGAD
jgi:POT family proton-dependent oligopeptide transporter